MVKLLEGMRVVEGAAFVAAPLAGMTLAQMGADVISFHAIRGGLEPHRWPVPRDGRSLFWAGLANTYFWIDPARDRAGVIATQILPFADPKVLALLGGFERAVYAA